MNVAAEVAYEINLHERTRPENTVENSDKKPFRTAR